MEPPLKRPRLSIFANEYPSAELDTARLQNDRHLKGRFEAIFQKYERDFAGVGDEVDLSTGEIIVNNGHLAGLIENADTRSEADESKGDEPPTPGLNSSPGRKRLFTNGRSMLRAMTVAPDCDDAYFENENADDVIDSIELIAENATLPEEEDDAGSGQSNDDLGDEDSEAEEDDALDLEDEGERQQLDQPVPIPMLQKSMTPGPQLVAGDSDDDSLFEVPMERDSSPDSLFDQPTEKSSATPYEDVDPQQFFDSLGELDSEAVIARFGDKVGQEVLELIQRRDKAELHIEAAWRIPVHIEEQESTRYTSAATPRPERSATTLSPASITPRKGPSLWTAPQRSRLELHQARTMTVIRAESEDPLQEGFGDPGPVEVRVAGISVDRAMRLLNRGMCPYCKRQFYSLPRAQGHLRAILDKTNGDPQGGLHNLASIEELLSAIDEDVVEDHEHATKESNNIGNSTDVSMLRTAEYKSPGRKNKFDPGKGADESDDDLFMNAADTYDDKDDDGLSQVGRSSSTPHRRRFANSKRLPARTPSDVTSLVINDSDDEGSEPEDRPQSDRAQFVRQQHRTLSHQNVSHKASARRLPSVVEPMKVPEITDSPPRENDSGSHDSHIALPEVKPSHLPLRPRKAKKEIRYCFKHKPTGKLRLSVHKKKQQPQARPSALPTARTPTQSPAHSPERPLSTGKPYKCAVCPKKYRNPNGLDYHKMHSPACYPAQQVNNNRPAPSGIPASASGIVIAISSRRRDVSVSDKENAGRGTSAENGSDKAADDPTITRHQSTSVVERCSKRAFPRRSSTKNAIRAQKLAGNSADSQSISQRQEQASDEQGQANFSDSASSDAEVDSETPNPGHHFTVDDYKSLVLHHELEGQDLNSFGELMANHYYDYRLPVDPLRGMGSQGDEWTEAEDVLLQDLSSNPQTLMETIRRRLSGRSQFEIGNRLASYFLAESHKTSRAVDSKRVAYYPDRGRVKKGSDRPILNYADIAGRTGDNVQTSAANKTKKPAQPLERRICRDLSPSGVWRGCGKVYSQRAALTRHWKETLRACFAKDFVPWMSDTRQRTRTTVENSVPCRTMSPGGTVRGCNKLFRQRSTLYRHWRKSGVGCRPHDYAERMKKATGNSSDADEIPESDHDAPVTRERAL